MSNSNPLTDNPLYQHMLTASLRENSYQSALREATCQLDSKFSRMITAPEQVQFLSLLVKLTGAKTAIEVGVFTGYGSLAIAQALPDDGALIACDTNATWANIGKPYWQQAGVADKIDLRIAPASETLAGLLPSHKAKIDFIFIDADKIHYDDYYELALQLLRPNGLVVLDNILWVSGQPVVWQDTPATKAINRLAEKVQKDDRVDCSLVPLSTGMLLAYKR